MNPLQNSPLAEASPLSIQEVMDMDVLALAKNPEARARAVAELRAQRERWKKAEAKGRKKVDATPVDLKNLLDDIKL